MKHYGTGRYLEGREIMERPILFNTTMVKAILDGRKSQTRRIIKGLGNTLHFGKLLGDWALSEKPYIKDGLLYWELQTDVDGSRVFTAKLPYQVGDTFWVREAFRQRFGMSYAWMDGCEQPIDDAEEIEYKAGGSGFKLGGLNLCPSEDYRIVWSEWAKWHPSIHMPRKVARIFLKVVDVRVERLQDITNADIKSEGTILAKLNDEFDNEFSEEAMWNMEFQILWNSTVKKQDLERYGWNANPYIWVIEFEVTKNGR